MMHEDDMNTLEEMENSKRKRPPLAKLLSRQDLDSFELEMLMTGDEF